eukprot:scaffold2481_cov145-Skeletonema_menzelii.AAC.8
MKRHENRGKYYSPFVQRLGVTPSHLKLSTFAVTTTTYQYLSILVAPRIGCACEHSSAVKDDR